jgi:tetratricopeptide (TPR) repeat protein
MSARLRDSDSAELAFRVRTLAWSVAGCLPLAALVAYYLEDTRHIGGLAVVGILLAGGVAGLGIGTAILIGSHLIGHGVVHLVTAAGNLAPGPSYSYQESLIARGRFTDAADAFRAHLALYPGDHDARLALAGLLASHLADPAGAEQLYREVRVADPSARRDWVVSQALVELYHGTGERGREMAELSRLADRYRGTRIGKGAKQALMALKDDTREAGDSRSGGHQSGG